jgi:hypothetical protein
MKTRTMILLCAALCLASCQSKRPKPQTVRTTTYHTGSLMMGAAGDAPTGATTVTETPYESPAYRAAGEALFSR